MEDTRASELAAQLLLNQQTALFRHIHPQVASRIDAFGKSLRRKHQGTKEIVLGNLPPAVAIRLKGAKPAKRRTASKARTT